MDVIAPADRIGPAFQAGVPHIRTCFILAAPGQEEDRAGHPAAGATGDNLNRILVHLHHHDPIRFPSVSKTDYRITNSFETVLFGDQTMPTDTQVLGGENLRRLAAQVQGYTTLVALSLPAILAIGRAVGPPTYHHKTHPGMRGLNNLFPNSDLPEDQAARVQERCRRYAKQLIQLKEGI